MKQYENIARLFDAFMRKICLIKRIRFRLLLAKSQLVDLRAANADLHSAPRRRIGRIQGYHSQQKEHPLAECSFSRVFAYGEYSRALRLTSKLVDLQAANADLHSAPRRRIGRIQGYPRQK